MLDMINFAKAAIQKSMGLIGYEIVKTTPSPPIEMLPEDIQLVEDVIKRQLSMVSPQGLYSTLAACKYVAENDVPGDFVECGVWRGGNAIIAAEIFKRYKVVRKVFLFDTFQGMTEPTMDDMTVQDKKPALEQYLKAQRESHNDWCFAPLTEVRSNFQTRGLLGEDVVFVEGKVEDTLRRHDNLPQRISILRLDTDWYESTKLELEVLYPLIVSGGFLIIDDYGFWSGSKKATDEFFSGAIRRPYFHPIDEQRRIAVINH
jgi:hypothetical protein